MPASRAPYRRSAAQRPAAFKLVAAACVAALLLAACTREPPPPSPAEVRAQIQRLLPATLADRDAWAADIQSAFAALGIRPLPPNYCAVLAVIEQESGYNPDPVVPGLAKIARAEVEKRAQAAGVPRLLVTAALEMRSPDGRSYAARLDEVRTEQDLDRIYQELIDSIPLGRRLLARANPVRTGGPMQVGIAFAEQHARARRYPYPVERDIREEVFSRRGGLYFGIAHLLGYKTSYQRLLYRFADFNAGLYASRNAAFQRAVSIASGVQLQLDGDLVSYGDQLGATESAVRTLAPALGLSDEQVHRDLRRGRSFEFEDTALYRDVYMLAERRAGGPLARAAMPKIRLQSPKISRQLTTEWFATRVEKRYRNCMTRAWRQ